MFSKMCTRCRIVKSFDQFSKGNRYKDGLQYTCKPCHSIQNRVSRANVIERKIEEAIVQYEIENKDSYEMEINMVTFMVGFIVSLSLLCIVIAIVWVN